jgi:phage repressor protein C with HTH and peptisase S24 domain
MNLQQRTDFGKRLRAMREALGRNMEEMNERTGFFRGAWGAFEKGKRLPTTEQLHRISETLKASADWLLNGEGPMFRDGAAAAPAPTGVVSIVELDVQVSAGDGSWPVEEAEKGRFQFDESYFRRHIGRDPRYLRILQVVGDSMEPTFRAGDPVMVDLSQPQPRVDGIWVIQQASGVLVKRLQFLAGGTVRVISDNQAYREQVLDLKEEYPDFRLVGQVVWSPRLH